MPRAGSRPLTLEQRPLEQRPLTQRPLPQRPLLAWALLVLIFAAGLWVRLYDLSDPPLDFHPTRQLHSALIARGMYYEPQTDVPDDQRDLAVTMWQIEGLIEPQVFERLAAWTYTWAGGENLQIPRLYAVAFWMGAAVFVTLLALELTGWAGALAAALFFLAWPYGVMASRAFQPEPLMLLLTAAALWAAVRWESRPGWAWAAAAGLLAGLAIYIKAVAVFFLAPALAVIVLSGGPRRALRSGQVWLMAGLAVLPYAVYHIDGVFLRGYLGSQFSQRFFPEMWTSPAFYLRWISNLSRAVPFELALAALLGALLARRPLHRALLLALWAGYFLYGMTLPHHISTHDYYHLPLYIPVALGLAGVAETLFLHLRGPLWFSRGLAALVLAAALVINIYGARTTLKRFDAAAQARALAEVGQALGPGASVVALSADYGGGLKYYAWINPVMWPTSADIDWQAALGDSFDFAAYFDEQVSSRDYFVITALDELEQQPELADLLSARYPVVHRSADLLVYDLRAERP